MRIALRFVRLFALIVWLGGLLFFPVVAQVAFTYLPTQHDAGTVVGGSLQVLHVIGLACGILLIVTTLALARNRRSLIFAGITAAMLLLTAGSQYGILPRMDADRIAAGGDIAKDCTTASCTDFNRLHPLSEYVEEAVMVGGIALTAMLACE